MALDLTGKGRTVALISNGGDLPGLGALGPLAALPYLEDQASLIERMTNLRVLPLAVNSSSSEEIAAFTATLAPSAGILCLDSLGDEVYQAVERPLAESGLPFFFNPQQSRPILILTAISKALALTGRDLSSARIVLAGFESDSLAVADFLLAAGAGNLVLCDRSGVIHKGRPGPTSWLKEQLAQKTNPQQIKGGLNRALAGADVYVSRATPMAVTKDVANMMAHRPILLNFSQNLASANPLTAGTEPIGLGFGPGPDTRLPANLLTALVLSGLFSGALKARARSITMAMRLAASRALEELIDEPGRLLPLFSRPRLVEKVATAVAAVAIPNSRPSPNAD
jgi:malate dehydrogenase (oxaloacetate-decarboxylating)